MVPKRTAHPLATVMESVRQRCAARCASSALWHRVTAGTPIPASRRLRGRTHCAHRASASQQSGVIPAAVPGGVDAGAWHKPEAVSANSPPQPTASWQLLLAASDRLRSFDWLRQLDCTDHRSALAVFKFLDCTFGSLTSALAPLQARTSRPQDHARS
ncbi:hypothetical protein B0H17DRAFT_1139703 [Mycena rosella]|uniref:Uncharacterized protein n=1 Tax=Mycena rosella TaxID=1033263 RepID=A0AAD7G8J3_MYCRO|nr:hypothetical protein B0H17DRAFT_1139703 [Mycena rosella]